MQHSNGKDDQVEAEIIELGDKTTNDYHIINYLIMSHGVFRKYRKYLRRKLGTRRSQILRKKS